MTTIPNHGDATAMSGTVSKKLAYSVKEACHLCGISRSYFYNEVKAGRGPVLTKAGRRTLIMHESLDTWLRSLTVKMKPFECAEPKPRIMLRPLAKR